jgi:protein-S-isoprenylcysteine O-methyltransferase Ste14
VKPLPYRDTGAAIAFYAAFIVFVGLEMRTRLRGGLNREGSSADRGSIVIVWGAVAGGLAGAFVLARSAHGAEIHSGQWPLFVVGILLMVAGIVLRQWSVHTLGRFFTVDVRIHENQTVVDTGPYRWVRHPSYTGLLLTLLGVGLALGNWAALALLIVVPTAGVVARIRVEERALERALGEPYRRFEATRARLIPGVW